MKSPVQLYLRVRLPDGSYPYLKAAFAPNGRIRPHQALHNGKQTHFPRSTYYLRFKGDGKRVWEPAGDDPSLAVINLQRRAHALAGTALGLAVPPAAVIPASINSPQVVSQPPAPSPTDRRLLSDCVDKYITETTEHKAHRTLYAYRLAVFAFCESLTGISPKKITVEAFITRLAPTQVCIEDINREDILTFAAALRKKGSSPRTIRNRVDFLQIFLHRFKIPSLLTGNSLPKFTQKKVRAYNVVELDRMFGHATQDEADLLHFLLCTGAREQEAQFACWSDVDLERKTYTVTEHLDLGYQPKDKEEGTLPIPDLLVDVLRARRERHPKGRLIFPGKHGGANGHALRVVKRLALRAGVNCGQCVNKAGKSCSAHPVCRHILLHKMRKTFASTLHHNGLPAQTLQRFLRHSDLNTTLRYIADQPDEQVRDTVNATFAGFGKVGGDR